MPVGTLRGRYPLLGGFCGRASVERGGPTHVGILVTAWEALCSGGLALSTATQKTAGTCPGRRSPRCCSCLSPGSGPRAWAACPAGGGQGSCRSVGHLQVPLGLTAVCLLRGQPGSSPSPSGTLCRGPPTLKTQGSCSFLGAPLPQGSVTAVHNPTCLRPSLGTGRTRAWRRRGEPSLAPSRHTQSTVEMQGERSARRGAGDHCGLRHCILRGRGQSPTPLDFPFVPPVLWDSDYPPRPREWLRLSSSRQLCRGAFC